MIKQILSLGSTSIRSFAYDFEVSIATIFHNEARFLKEWIEFHKLIGVEHFFLYNHCSQDNFEEVLSPYIKEGLVELFDWSEEATSRLHWRTIQNAALRDVAIRAKGVSKWVAFIDADEYIFPVRDKTLPQFLSHYEEYGAVTANWWVFGTSHIEYLKEDQLAIEQLLFRAEEGHTVNDYVKSIVQINFIDTTVNFENSHQFPLIDSCPTVNAHRKPLPDYTGELFVSNCADKTRPTEVIRIHHYTCRDEHFLHQVKLKRPYCLDPYKRSYILNLAQEANNIEDRSILIYAEALKQAVFQNI